MVIVEKNLNKLISGSFLLVATVLLLNRKLEQKQPVSTFFVSLFLISCINIISILSRLHKFEPYYQLAQMNAKAIKHLKNKKKKKRIACFESIFFLFFLFFFYYRWNFSKAYKIGNVQKIIRPDEILTLPKPDISKKERQPIKPQR